jgi:hypothetical protein
MTTPTPDKPDTAADLKEYLASADDFAFEREIYSVAKGLGFQVQHAGLYTDPVTGKPRQFDVRASCAMTEVLTDKEGHQRSVRRPVFAVLTLGRRNDALPGPIRGIASVSVSRVLLGRPKWYSLGYFRQFRTDPAALAEAAVLALDPTRPYTGKLCRCKYPDCQKFYFAQKDPRGGPPNRTYCTPEHRRLHNNSAQRKQLL